MTKSIVLLVVAVALVACVHVGETLYCYPPEGGVVPCKGPVYLPYVESTDCSGHYSLFMTYTVAESQNGTCSPWGALSRQYQCENGGYLDEYRYQKPVNGCQSDVANAWFRTKIGVCIPDYASGQSKIQQCGGSVDGQPSGPLVTGLPITEPRSLPCNDTDSCPTFAFTAYYDDATCNGNLTSVATSLNPAIVNSSETVQLNTCYQLGSKPARWNVMYECSDDYLTIKKYLTQCTGDPMLIENYGINVCFENSATSSYMNFCKAPSTPLAPESHVVPDVPSISGDPTSPDAPLSGSSPSSSPSALGSPDSPASASSPSSDAQFLAVTFSTIFVALIVTIVLLN